LNFSKNGQILDFSGSGLHHHRFLFVKKLCFLSFNPPWTDSLWKTEDSAVSWRSVEQRCNLAQKWQFSSPNRRGQTLTKLKNILYGVYWDQYKGLFETPAFWLNVFFSKSRFTLFYTLDKSIHCGNCTLSILTGDFL
jgi:hypothetical protein